MPPAISDHESDGSDDGGDVVPARIVPKTAEEDEASEAEDDEEDDEVFVVEKILKHDFDVDGNVIYQVKWLGYDKKKDLTWEPRDNLETASEILADYHDQIGGEPTHEPEPIKKASKGGKRGAVEEISSQAKKRGRKSNGAKNIDSPSVKDTAGKKLELPQGSWEDHVARVTNLIEEEVPDEKVGRLTKRLLGMIEWPDGSRHTQHSLNTLRQKCPQKLLDYYQAHLKFTPAQKDVLKPATIEDSKDDEALTKEDSGSE